MVKTIKGKTFLYGFIETNGIIALSTLASNTWWELNQREMERLKVLTTELRIL